MFVCPECGAAQPMHGHCPADGMALAPVGEDILLGTTIGAYRVARLLGIGGMGRVYKGVHPTIGSRVAIKVLSRECSDRRELVDRFFAEAKAVNLIRHESIVNVLDLSVLLDGRPYIIMEYLDGAPLAAIVEATAVNRAPIPLGGLARLAAEVLDALGAAHAKGIVHRDLKPDNIFVTPSGRPKVLDFGIAKLNDAAHSATRTGSLLGTPHYMAPEQAAGRLVDHRADIYAMGVILFECATTQKPFQAESLFDLLRQHVEAPPPSPRALRPDMPPEFELVVLTALAKSPDQRFASAQAMSAALQHATAQLPADAWQPITGALSPSVAGAWAPTPPVSWASQRPPSSAQHTPSQPPTALQRPRSQDPARPTMSAGQVTARSGTTGSKKALWVVLGLVVGGGGIAAAVVAGGRSSSSSGANGIVAGGGSSEIGSGGGPLVAGGPLPAGSASEPAKSLPNTAVTPTAEHPATTDHAEKPDDEKDGRAAQAEVDDDDLKDAYKTLDEALAQLPPDVRQQMGQYKDLAKLSPKERLKKLQELAKLGGDLDALGSVPVVAGGAAPGAWVSRHSIDPPPGYDANHLDVAAFVPWAIAAAKREIPDAQLFRIDTNGVAPDGRANLSLATLASDHGSIDLRFVSASHAKRDPTQPIGARRDWKCEFRVEATPEGVDVSPIDGWDCTKEKPLPLPRCSFVAVWKKAIARKAPSANAIGNLGYRSDFDGKATWYFDIGFGTDVAFSEMFRDDC